MRIAYVAKKTVRGIEQRLARFVEEAGGHETRVLTDRPWHMGERWKWQDIADPAARHAVLDWAEALHFCGATSPRQLGRPALVDQKLCVAQHFGLLTSRRLVYGSLWTDDELRRIRLALVAEGWERDPFWKGRSFALLPGVSPIHDALYQPIPLAKRKRHACFSPRKLAPQPPAAKGVDETRRALRDQPLDFVHNLPPRDCMFRKREAWVGIDELLTPMVHFSGFEFLSLGVPCLQSWDDVTERSVLAATGAAAMPFRRSSFASLSDDVRRALAEPAERWAAECDAARAWMERHMDPLACARQYLALYERG